MPDNDENLEQRLSAAEDLAERLEAELETIQGQVRELVASLANSREDDA